MKLSEVSKLTGWSIRQLRHKIVKKELFPGHRGRYVVIHPDDVEKLAEQAYPGRPVAREERKYGRTEKRGSA